MTTNWKFSHYVEIGEKIGAFFNLIGELQQAAFRPMFKWGEKYWEARDRHGTHWYA